MEPTEHLPIALRDNIDLLAGHFYQQEASQPFSSDRSSRE